MNEGWTASRSSVSSSQSCEPSASLQAVIANRSVLSFQNARVSQSYSGPEPNRP